MAALVLFGAICIGVWAHRTGEHAERGQVRLGTEAHQEHEAVFASDTASTSRVTMPSRAEPATQPEDGHAPQRIAVLIRVASEHGQPVPSCIVRLRDSAMHLHSGTTDRSGAVLITEVRVGAAHLDLGQPYRLRGPASLVVSRDRQEVPVQCWAPVGFIEGRIVDTTDQGIDCASITTRDVAIVSGPSGEFSAPFYEHDSNDSVSVLIRKHGYRTIRVEVAADGERKVIRLPRAGHLSLQVVDAIGRPSVGAWQCILGRPAASGIMVEQILDVPDAKPAEVANLEAMRYVAVIRRQAENDWSNPPAQRITLSDDGHTRVGPIVVRRGVPLSVSVRGAQNEPLQAARVTVGEWLGEPKTGGEGIAPHGIDNDPRIGATWSWAIAGRATTDSSGVAGVSVDPVGEYHVLVEAEGHADAAAWVAPGTRHLEIVMGGLRAVTWLVDPHLVADLRAIGWEAIVLEITSRNATRSLDRIEINGPPARFPVAPGAYELRLAGMKPAPGRSESARSRVSVPLGSVIVDAGTTTVDMREFQRSWPFGWIDAVVLHEQKIVAGAPVMLDSAEEAPAVKLRRRNGPEVLADLATDSQGRVRTVATAGPKVIRVRVDGEWRSAEVVVPPAGALVSDVIVLR